MRRIYTRWIKEALEEQYNIFPVNSYPNPKNPSFKVWEYSRTEQLSAALDKLMEDKQND